MMTRLRRRIKVYRKEIRMLMRIMMMVKISMILRVRLMIVLLNIGDGSLVKHRG